MLSIPTSPPQVIIVDDDAAYLELLQCAMQAQELAVVCYQEMSSEQIFAMLDAKVVLLDLFMPSMDGIEIIRQLGKHHFSGVLILLSGQDQSVLNSAQELAQAHGLTVGQTFCKPVSLRELVQAVSDSVSQSKPDKIGKPQWQPTTDDLDQAFSQHQLLLYYQPKVDLHTQTIVGFEALVRWNHPVHGLVSPALFVPLAERTGRMGILTEQVIALALPQLAKWAEHGMFPEVAVNISADNLRELEFATHLLNQLQHYRIDPSQLILELTETSVMNEAVTSLDILIRLRMRGVRLSIDDFGTGYSSLSQLHRIPFSELKIDQKFVDRCVYEPESQAIVETCIMLGHKLGMQVTAEGVERAEIRAMLVKLGCDKGQGYFWSKPIAGDVATEQLLRQTMEGSPYVR